MLMEPNPEHAAFAMRALSNTRRTAGESSPLAFAQLYLPDLVSKPSSPMHRELFEVLATFHKNRGSRLAIAAPRGHAKSTIATLVYVVWCLAYAKESFIVVASGTEDQANRLLNHVKGQLESNPLIRADFPELVPQARTPPWKKNGILLGNGTMLVSYASSQNPRGIRHLKHRPTLFIADDLESKELVASELQRVKLADWFSGTYLKAGSPETNTIVVGTILHPESLLARLMDPLKSDLSPSTRSNPRYGYLGLARRRAAATALLLRSVGIGSIVGGLDHPGEVRDVGGLVASPSRDPRTTPGILAERARRGVSWAFLWGFTPRLAQPALPRPYVEPLMVRPEPARVPPVWAAREQASHRRFTMPRRPTPTTPATPITPGLPAKPAAAPKPVAPPQLKKASGRQRRRGRVDVPAASAKGTRAVAAKVAEESAIEAKPARPAASAKPKSSACLPKPAKRHAKRAKLSALDAAAEVLGGLTGKERADGIGTADLIERMHRARLWTSPGGKTPAATLYAAMLREIGTKKTESRFKRVGPGRFLFKMSGKSSRGEAGA